MDWGQVARGDPWCGRSSLTSKTRQDTCRPLMHPCHKHSHCTHTGTSHPIFPSHSFACMAARALTAAWFWLAYAWSAMPHHQLPEPMPKHRVETWVEWRTKQCQTSWKTPIWLASPCSRPGIIRDGLLQCHCETCTLNWEVFINIDKSKDLDNL